MAELSIIRKLFAVPNVSEFPLVQILRDDLQEVFGWVDHLMLFNTMLEVVVQPDRQGTNMKSVSIQ